MSDFSGDARVTAPRAAGWLSFAAAVLVVSGAFKILVVYALATYGGPRLPETPARA